MEQATAYTKFVGRNRISGEQKQAITEAIDSSALVAAAKDAMGTDLLVNALAERFEEMCRRRGAEMTEGLRRSVVKLLAAELWVNHTALGAGPDRLLSATVQHGAVAPELLKEFPQQPTYIVTLAMVGSPISPRTMLQRLEKRLAEVSGEPEFSLLAHNRPSAFLKAAIRHPANLRERLLREQEAVENSHRIRLKATHQPDSADKRR